MICQSGSRKALLKLDVGTSSRTRIGARLARTALLGWLKQCSNSLHRNGYTSTCKTKSLSSVDLCIKYKMKSLYMDLRANAVRSRPVLVTVPSAGREAYIRKYVSAS
jgi:hypothetical protein